MSAFTDDRNRHIIPRWRSFHRTALTSETYCLNPGIPRPPFDFRDKLTQWQDNPTLSFAADLLGTAIAVGEGPEARVAAEALLADTRADFACVRSLAERFLAPEKWLPNADCPEFINSAYIHGLKVALCAYAHNPIGWSDLSLAYESLGFRRQADRAMRVALTLGPTNRYILRCASRLYHHHDEYGHAHQILLSSGLAAHDPWIAAAEIAAAGVTGRKSRYVKSSRDKVLRGTFSAGQVTELASAVGTAEFVSGKRKRAKDLLQMSLDQPTENAIAQAAWVVRRAPEMGLYSLQSEMNRSPEAKAWQDWVQGNWDNGLRETERWLADQPFSSKPAVVGSYLASGILSEHARGARICNAGLIANPANFGLLNNLACAEAYLGNTAKAVSTFERIDRRALDPIELVVWTATSGLLAFRQGHAMPGRLLYMKAMEDAASVGDQALVALAALHLALEELASGVTTASSTVQMAVLKAKAVERADVQWITERVVSRAGLQA